MKSEKRIEYNLKQLNIEIPAELKEQIKLAAEKRNIPQRRLILRIIIKGLREEDYFPSNV